MRFPNENLKVVFATDVSVGGKFIPAHTETEVSASRNDVLHLKECVYASYEKDGEDVVLKDSRTADDQRLQDELAGGDKKPGRKGKGKKDDGEGQ